jgi:hypothetical protein
MRKRHAKLQTVQYILPSISNPVGSGKKNNKEERKIIAYQPSNFTLKKVKNLKIFLQIMLIEEACASIDNQPRHVVDRSDGVPNLFLEVLKNFLVNVERVISDESVHTVFISPHILCSCPGAPVEWTTCDNGFYDLTNKLLSI